MDINGKKISKQKRPNCPPCQKAQPNGLKTWATSLMDLSSPEITVEIDVCAASPRPDSLMLRGSVEPAWTLLKGHLMLQDNYRLYMDIESTC